MYQLHDEHHQQCPELFKTASEIEEEKSISRYLDDPDCIVYVAEFNGAVIGFVTAHFCELVSTVSKPVMTDKMESKNAASGLANCKRS